MIFCRHEFINFWMTYGVEFTKICIFVKKYLISVTDCLQGWNLFLQPDELTVNPFDGRSAHTPGSSQYKGSQSTWLSAKIGRCYSI
jgi:hypothetical protein